MCSLSLAALRLVQSTSRNECFQILFCFLSVLSIGFGASIYKTVSLIQFFTRHFFGKQNLSLAICFCKIKQLSPNSQLNNVAFLPRFTNWKVTPLSEGWIDFEPLDVSMDIRVAAWRNLKLLECVSEKHKFYIKEKVGTSSGSIFLTNSIFQHLNYWSRYWTS